MARRNLRRANRQCNFVISQVPAMIYGELGILPLRTTFIVELYHFGLRLTKMVKKMSAK